MWYSYPAEGSEGTLTLVFSEEEMAATWHTLNKVREHCEFLGIPIPDDEFWDGLKEEAREGESIGMDIPTTVRGHEFAVAVLAALAARQEQAGYYSTDLKLIIQEIEHNASGKEFLPS